jgi:hypothetical protein
VSGSAVSAPDRYGQAIAMNTIFLMELLLFYGAVLVWAGWELWSVRPSLDKAAKKRDAASKKAARHPER